MTSDVFDLAARASELKGPADFFRDHEVPVFLWPNAWRAVEGVDDFEWTEVPFVEGSVDQIPATPGIYAFKIKLRETIMPDHSIIVYIGESGAGREGTVGNLQRRYKEYLRAKRRGAKRQKFAWLFERWPDDLVFCFASIDWGRAELGKLESDLSDAIIPVCSKMDFSAHVRRVVEILRN